MLTRTLLSHKTKLTQKKISHRISHARQYSSSGEKKTLVLGGSGSLGSALVSALKAEGYSVISVDFRDNNEADAVVTLDAQKGLVDMSSDVGEKIGDQAFDLVACVAGGWAGGAPGDSGFVQSCSQMIDMNLNSAILASDLAGKYLNQGGLFVLTGSTAAEGRTGGMVAYGMVKAATHHLARDLHESNKNFITRAILPETIDTPANREGMPGADFSSWTPTEEIAEEIIRWTKGSVPDKPLVAVITRKNETTFSPLD
eukprot:TRINITY_DN2143_c1_g1_i1.p1 TRINITY_DN2143_c1_g1~~TRINITY_DN2143_c1_g1_i1.p1  ORF type:complete len:257 (-),score=78.24 TRINITY_DN2143_c1_g1_i1:39-809(-)